MLRIPDPFFLLAVGLTLAGCGAAPQRPAGSPGRGSTAVAATDAESVAAANPIVARVNGEAIYRENVVSVLYRGRGRQVLEELVLTELVRQEARREGLHAGRELVEREMERILAGLSAEAGDREALLGYMLKSRGITRAQFGLIVERQALLRQLVRDDSTVSESDLADEFTRQHGRRVTVRLIVLTNLRQVDEALGRLSGGKSFAEVVGEMSQDEVSLGRGGLVGPFSAADGEVAPGWREAGLALEEVGQRSEPVHYRDKAGGERWGLLELEAVTEADEADFQAVREELLRSIRQRRVSQKMADLLQRLQESAAIEVVDPILRRGSD